MEPNNELLVNKFWTFTRDRFRSEKEIVAFFGGLTLESSLGPEEFARALRSAGYDGPADQLFALLNKDGRVLVAELVTGWRGFYTPVERVVMVGDSSDVPLTPQKSSPTQRLRPASGHSGWENPPEEVGAVRQSVRELRQIRQETESPQMQLSMSAASPSRTLGEEGWGSSLPEVQRLIGIERRSRQGDITDLGRRLWNMQEWLEVRMEQLSQELLQTASALRADSAARDEAAAAGAQQNAMQITQLAESLQQEKNVRMEAEARMEKSHLEEKRLQDQKALEHAANMKKLLVEEQQIREQNIKAFEHRITAVFEALGSVKSEHLQRNLELNATMAIRSEEISALKELMAAEQAEQQTKFSTLDLNLKNQMVRLDDIKRGMELADSRSDQRVLELQRHMKETEERLQEVCNRFSGEDRNCREDLKVQLQTQLEHLGDEIRVSQSKGASLSEEFVGLRELFIKEERKRDAESSTFLLSLKEHGVRFEELRQAIAVTESRAQSQASDIADRLRSDQRMLDFQRHIKETEERLQELCNRFSGEDRNCREDLKMQLQIQVDHLRAEMLSSQSKGASLSAEFVALRELFTKEVQELKRDAESSKFAQTLKQHGVRFEELRQAMAATESRSQSVASDVASRLQAISTIEARFASLQDELRLKGVGAAGTNVVQSTEEQDKLRQDINVTVEARLSALREEEARLRQEIVNNFEARMSSTTKLVQSQNATSIDQVSEQFSKLKTALWEQIGEMKGAIATENHERVHQHKQVSSDLEGKNQNPAMSNQTLTSQQLSELQTELRQEVEQIRFALGELRFEVKQQFAASNERDFLCNTQSDANVSHPDQERSTTDLEGALQTLIMCERDQRKADISDFELTLKEQVTRIEEIRKAQESLENLTVSRFVEMSETIKEAAKEEKDLRELNPWQPEIFDLKAMQTDLKEMVSNLDLSVRELQTGQGGRIQNQETTVDQDGVDKQILELQKRLELALRQSENRVDKWISEVNKCMSETRQWLVARLERVGQ